MKHYIFFTCSLIILLVLKPYVLYADKPAGPLFITSDRCLACHNGLTDDKGDNVSIGSSWRGSMMANAARDPYWQAAVRREIIEHPDAKDAIEDKCASCHMPMARYMTKVCQKKGSVFAHLPFTKFTGKNGNLALDGVSCTMCHQITADKLGSKESFTAGFTVDTENALGERNVYGPFEVEKGRRRVMQSSSQAVPVESSHIQESSFCASCHTLFTHSLGPDGQVSGELPEQVPYLEWYHSSYKEKRSCQSCHMPVLDKATAVSSVLGLPRPAFSQHVFRGGNFFMPAIFNKKRNELNVAALPSDLSRTVDETIQHLESKAARLTITNAKLQNGHISMEVNVSNLAGHKLPTAYPSRRVWLSLEVKDRSGNTIFSSGRFNPDGSIEGNDNDLNAKQYEPHYTSIDNQEQVQIYETIMANPKNEVTTGLLEAVRFVKDNRILPKGFDKKTAERDIAVQGVARDDSDFNENGDRLLYNIQVNNAAGPFQVDIQLYYQPIGYRWAKNLSEYKAMETKRFVDYYDEMSRTSAVPLAHKKITIQ
ncbi:MAG: cytochrome c family protein [Phycisphaerae bacterium]|nr:cytochrome c family protein [Phycisphaerae bacterium]